MGQRFHKSPELASTSLVLKYQYNTIKIWN
jgi:hypothetical protein